MALTSDEAEYIEHLALRIRRGDSISADLPWIPAEGDHGAGRPSLITERKVARICLTCKKPRCTGMCREYRRAKNDLIARARCVEKVSPRGSASKTATSTATAASGRRAEKQKNGKGGVKKV